MLFNKLLFAVALLFAVPATAQVSSTLNLMPVPQKLEVGTQRLALTPNFSVAIQSNQADPILRKAVDRFLTNLSQKMGISLAKKLHQSNDKNPIATLQIDFEEVAQPYIGIDESYTLTVNNKQIMLKAPTTIGALHGLQTLRQLLTKDEQGAYYFPGITIADAPRFAWRGLMIDVARHFIPAEVIKRNIEAMATVKMNVLHLHLTDHEGFNIESKVFPALHEKGSNGGYLTQNEIKELIAFAADRGITVVPEFDVPGHSKSWFLGYLQLASSSNAANFDLFGLLSDMKEINPQKFAEMFQTLPIPAIDPSKDYTYEFMDQLMEEMAALFPTKYIHIGADENNGVVWRNNPSIAAFMKANNIEDTHALQAYFVGRMEKILTKHYKQMVVWEEAFSKDLSKGSTIQMWQNPTYLNKALDNETNVLVSRGFYIDLFFPAYIHYNNPDIPADLPASTAKFLRGGEATQWTEIADKTNIETRIWPRTAAIAERLWSPATINDVDDMYRRLFVISAQLDEQGLQHAANYERSLRSISPNNFYELKTLTDVLTPIKGYKRLFMHKGNPTNSDKFTAPLSQISDVIFVDTKEKWQFRAAVKSYLEKKDALSEKYLLERLKRWQNNHERLKNELARSSKLTAIQQHSENLAKIATIGIEAINQLKNNQAPSSDWVKQQMEILQQANQSFGGAYLNIVSEIESLVKQELVDLPAGFSIF